MFEQLFSSIYCAQITHINKEVVKDELKKMFISFIFLTCYNCKRISDEETTVVCYNRLGNETNI